jgi:alpha-mannosidase
MLENLREMSGFPATPRIEQKHVGAFFQDLETTAGESLPVWNGELYLEYHRGTYTTQSRNKRANRKSEFMLHDAEFLAAMASLNEPAYTYPNEAFRDLWRLVCLNQFHDIIPGSSITDVYTDSQAQYQHIGEEADSVRHGALQAIAGRISGDVLVANPTSFDCNDLALWRGDLREGRGLQRADGTPVTTQRTDGGVLLDLHGIAPLSIAALNIAADEAPAPPTHLVATSALLENDLVRVELDHGGDITRIYDKRAQREVLAPGMIGNQMQAFEDRPMNWDAWDVDIFFEDKLWTAEPAFSTATTFSASRCATTARASTSTRRSTGASGTSCSRSRSRWISSRPLPRTRSSGATCSDQRIATRAGTGRASKPARRSGST